MQKKFFNYPKNGKTRGLRIDRWLLLFGIAFLFCGLIFRILEKFTAIGPESGPFLVLGIFIVALGATGWGIAKLRGD